MSLPGDRRIDTDLNAEPCQDNLDRIREMCDVIESEMAGVADAYTVLEDDDASPEAKSLALRMLDRATMGYTQLLDTIREEATRQHEEIQTLQQTDE